MNGSRRKYAIGLTLAVVLAVAAMLPILPALAGPKASKTWKSVAKKLRASSKAEAKADYQLALARAQYLTGSDREDAIDTAKEEFQDAKSIAGDAYKARLELAADLGETDLPRVEIDPADFVAGIDHPLLPFTVGSTWTYEAQTDEGLETIVVTVLPDTKVIMGVTCTVVRDTVSIGGELIEDTLDWYAQDKAGNVWYMGEIAKNYENGRLTDLDGSWEGGVDGAQPGIIMPALPAVGDLYRQEFLMGEAEDYGEVLALSESVTVKAGTFNGCLKTLDGTPIEPDATENKFYAPGVGVVLEENPETGERLELVSSSLK